MAQSRGGRQTRKETGAGVWAVTSRRNPPIIPRTLCQCYVSARSLEKKRSRTEVSCSGCGVAIEQHCKYGPPWIFFLFYLFPCSSPLEKEMPEPVIIPLGRPTFPRDNSQPPSPMPSGQGKPSQPRPHTWRTSQETKSAVAPGGGRAASHTHHTLSPVAPRRETHASYGENERREEEPSNARNQWSPSVKKITIP